MTYPQGTEEIRLVRDRFGDVVELVDEQDESVSHRVLAEFRHAGGDYAVLQSDELRKEHELLVLRITVEDGEPQLEDIDDDDEWETVSELADELVYASGLDQTQG